MITIRRYNSQSFTQAEEEAVNELHDNLTAFFQAMGFNDTAIDLVTEDLYNYLDSKMVEYIKLNKEQKNV